MESILNNQKSIKRDCGMKAALQGVGDETTSKTLNRDGWF